ncbi:MBL fold metallo-hydrolase [Gemmatimonas sp.]|uniref:MBL fold metallo-hydrolase n=1 Tax=Gemmatimonas sp. TaxID=1962908 RepID=UPI003982EFAC
MRHRSALHRPLRRLAVLASCCVVASPLAAQVNYDTIQVRAVQLTPGLHVLFGAGGNIGVSTGVDGTFIIDDQFAPLTPKIVAAIRTLTEKPVKFVLNTHWHGDHSGGNENFGNAGAVIVAHDNVRKRMSSTQFVAALNQPTPGAPHAALPVVTFSSAVTFHVNGDSIAVFHVSPAHTDGDVIVHFLKANVVHMGDVFNNTGLPFIDRSSGGTVAGVLVAADQVYAMANADTRIVPGHGQVADRERLKAWRTAIGTVQERVQREVRARKTIEQILAMKLSAEYLREWPGGHDRFIRAVFDELTAAASR